MNKKYRLEFTDGTVFEGDSPEAVVESMKNRSYFTAGKTLEEYMRGYARRTYMLFGDNTIRVSSPKAFVQSLLDSPEISLEKSVYPKGD